MAPQLPQYDTGPLNINLLQYFTYQQFGYSVSINGNLDTWNAKLFISAPGDTHRFMEDNRGENYGRVYAWRAEPVLYGQRTWWQMLARSPLSPVQLEGVTYRAFGKRLASSETHLIVSSYPLYDVPFRTIRRRI